MSDSEKTNIYAVEIVHGPPYGQELWRATLDRQSGVVELTRWKDGSCATFEALWERKKGTLVHDIAADLADAIEDALRQCIRGEMPNLHVPSAA